MQTNLVKQFVALRSALEQERARIGARLKTIEDALSGMAVANAPTPPVKPTPPAPPIRRKPKLSAAGKARIIAAQKARWAKIRAAKAAAAKPAPVQKPQSKPGAGRKAKLPDKGKK